MRNVTSLDGLRGLAVIGVLLFHTGHLSGGFLGVDLFFVLSGYLITARLLRDAPVSPAGFWGRRIRRLAPALVLMLAVVCPLVWVVGSADLLRTTLDDGPWVQANLANWHLLAESAGYWDRFGEARVFGHLWSIAVEEQFYLVWPVIVGLAGARRIGVVAAAGSVASLILMIALVDSADPSRVYTGTDTRAFSLLLGAVAAAVPAGTILAATTGRRADVAAALCTAGIGGLWLLADGVRSRWLFTGGLFVHSLAAAVLIALCVRNQGTVVARALSWWPLRRAGLISYSLYLWHWPVIVLLSRERTGWDGWVWTGAVVAVSTGAATLSKHLVEDPIRFRAGWARGRTGVVVFVVAMAALAALWRLVPPPAPVTIDVTRLS
jgi:peptidoglycan/LPS O-acetylase OafA/YrhL